MTDNMLSTLHKIGLFLSNRLDAKLLVEDTNSWVECMQSFPRNKLVPVSYKPTSINYQREYFSAVYDNYCDISMVLYRGGTAVAILPMCIYEHEGIVNIGCNGLTMQEPLFARLPKSEAQRKIIRNILESIAIIPEYFDIKMSDSLVTTIPITDEGSSQWQRVWMESGARAVKVSWYLYADLFLDSNEISHRTRRTNKYSIEQAHDDFDIEIYDSVNGINEAFEEFHDLHRLVSGRETRSQATWDIQRNNVTANCDATGYDFVVLLKDKSNGALAGAALFECTPQSAYYSVAAYDRSRFSKPVGHVVQAVAMDYMKTKGVRWYVVGERPYPGECHTIKEVNIGKYKEGFATHIFPHITMELNIRNISNIV